MRSTLLFLLSGLWETVNINKIGHFRQILWLRLEWNTFQGVNDWGHSSFSVKWFTWNFLILFSGRFKTCPTNNCRMFYLSNNKNCKQACQILNNNSEGCPYSSVIVQRIHTTKVSKYRSAGLHNVLNTIVVSKYIFGYKHGS